MGRKRQIDLPKELFFKEGGRQAPSQSLEIKNNITEVENPTGFTGLLRRIIEERGLTQEELDARKQEMANQALTEARAANIACDILFFDHVIEKAEEKLRELKRKAQSKRNQFFYVYGPALEQYARENLQDGKRSVEVSEHIASATLSFRKPPKPFVFKMEDAEKYASWCDANGVDGYHTEVKPLLDPAYKWSAENDGQVPDGLSRIECRESFNIS